MSEVAAIQGQVEHFALTDHLAQAADRGLDQIGVGLHVDLFGLSSNRKMNSHRRGLIHVQGDTLLQVLLETFGCDLKAVVPNGKFQQQIVSAAVRSRGAGEAGFDLPGGHGGPDHDGPGGIRNGTAETARYLLPEKRRAHPQRREDHHQPSGLNH